MPKKGKGRGRGRGSSTESNVPRPESERRPGRQEEPSRGQGRGRGHPQQKDKAEQPLDRGASRGTETTPTSSAKSPEPVPQASVPPFFARETTPATSQQAHVRETTPATSQQAHVRETTPATSQQAHGMEEGSGASAAFAQEVETQTQASSRKRKQGKAEGQELAKLTGLSLEYKEPCKLPLAKRPGYAVINDRNIIPLYVNYFKLTYKDAIIYHYDIDIAEATRENTAGKSVFSEGRTLKQDIQHKVKHVERQKRRNMGKAKCREIISKMFRTNETLRRFCPVYDGQRNLFTSQPLPCTKETQFPVDITLEERMKRFFVIITPVVKKDNTNIISLEPLKELYANRSSEIPSEVLLVYETIMNHREPPFTQVHFRNSFFSLEGRDRHNLEYGLEIWRGYHQTVQLTQVGPVVVINLAAKAFHKAGPVIDYASDVLRKDITRLPRLLPPQVRSLTEALKGVQIKVTHQRHPRKYKIRSVTERPASEIMIEIDRSSVSVAQYFLQKYNRRLDYPFLPCLLMQTSTNTTYIPMETCDVCDGQPKIGKLSAELTSKMIRSTAVEPRIRKDAIVRTAADVNDRSRRYLNAFGLLMNISLMQVNGRIIAAPQLAYGGHPDDNTRIAKPDKRGVWRVEGGQKFYKIVKIDNWVLISFADRRWFGHEVLNKYCQFLVQSGRKCGMQLDRPQSIEIYGREVSTEQALDQAKKSGAQMAIVVLNRRDPHHTYDEVKFLADFKYNLVTQCMEDKTLGRINDQITTNVCLKINVKLGGINHILHQKLAVFCQPVTVLGIDAIHWTRGYGYPSIVSVVGSLNPSASRYALACGLQRNVKEDKISQEIIKDMKRISSVILRKFVEVNNGLEPVKIIVFRDGVSVGQFQHALDYEVSGLQEACREVFGKILHITYLIVQKRHQTRLFPVRSAQGVGKNLNVPPGTCVDRDITHPVYYDYFICSHEGIQGTSKPAHYTILHDDNRFNCEELQQLCYFLCHTNVRCTRSVSLPAPVMYADLAAARAKKYADLHITSDNASTIGSDSSQRDLPSDVEKAIRGMQSFDKNMFYV